MQNLPPVDATTISPSADVAQTGKQAVPEHAAIKAYIETFTQQQILRITPLNPLSTKEAPPLGDGLTKPTFIDMPLQQGKHQLPDKAVVDVLFNPGKTQITIAQHIPVTTTQANLSNLPSLLEKVMAASPNGFVPVRTSVDVIGQQQNAIEIKLAGQHIALPLQRTQALISPGPAQLTLTTSPQGWVVSLSRDNQQLTLPVSPPIATKLFNSQLGRQALDISALVQQPQKSNVVVADSSRRALLDAINLDKTAQQQFALASSTDARGNGLTNLRPQLVISNNLNGNQIEIKFQPARDVLSRLPVTPQLSAALDALAHTKAPDRPAMTDTTDNKITQLLRDLLPRTDATKPVDLVSLVAKIEQLNRMISAPDSSLNGSILEPLKPLLDAKSAPPVGLLRALLQAPPLVISPTVLMGTPTQPGLVSSLNTLLQLFQFASVAQHDNVKLQTVLDAVNQVIPGKTNSGGANSLLLNELSGFDQSQRMTETLSKVLNQHTTAKLSGSDAGQIQNPMFYALSLPFDPIDKDIELLLEKRVDDDTKDANNGQKAWQLSLRLDVGKYGVVLAKASIREQHLGLHFICDNQPLCQRVDSFSPLLEARLSKLGIQVTFAPSQVGVVPDTLKTQSYHLIETKA